MKYKRCIIIGGGTSIADGVKLGLWDKIKDECVFANNYAVRYFPNPTALTFVDISFYSINRLDLPKFPLIVTREHPNIKDSNIIKLKSSANDYYGKDSFAKGIYSMKLVGLFSTTLAIALGFTEIYLLGMDQGSINGTQTHFYENEFRHRGVGFKNNKTGEKRYNTMLYERPADVYWQCYQKSIQEDGIKIINVSPQSKINVFTKMDYGTFLKTIEDDPVKIDQNKCRDYLRNKMLGYDLLNTQAENQQENNPNFLVPTEQPVGVLNRANDVNVPMASNKGNILN